jgi:hypothetical protein
LGRAQHKNDVKAAKKQQTNCRKTQRGSDILFHYLLISVKNQLLKSLSEAIFW